MPDQFLSLAMILARIIFESDDVTDALLDIATDWYDDDNQ
jgi:hypothetical protein